MRTMNWSKIIFVQYDIPLYASYSAKDFRIEYKSKFGLLQYGLHLPYACPKVYTEEEIIQKCKKQWPNFLKAENYIEKEKELLEQEGQRFMRSENYFSDIWNWVEKNVEADIQPIIREYIISQYQSRRKLMNRYWAYNIK